MTGRTSSSHTRSPTLRGSPSVGGNRDSEDARIARLYELGFLSTSDRQRIRSNTDRTSIISPKKVPAMHDSTQLSRPDSRRQPLHDSAVGSGAASGDNSERGSSRGVTTAQSSSNQPPPLRSRRGMTGMLDIDRQHTRRERTFVGGECIICTEDLSVTLKGERILQLTCAHVCHEACFYEFIREFDSQTCPGCHAVLGLDSTRGGNVLDLEKLSSMVRLFHPSQPQPGTASATPVPWDFAQRDFAQQGSTQQHQHLYYSRPPSQQRERQEAFRSPPLRSPVHMRGESNGTDVTSSQDPRNMQYRRQKFDNQSVETIATSNRNTISKNPIPYPTVLLRSEYPTMTRSGKQQSLTCLVTVEMPETKWRPNVDDLRGLSRAPSVTRDREPPSHVRGQSSASTANGQYDESEEAQEELEGVSEELFSRVDNWHGLDFSRFGKLRLYGTLQVGKDRQSWQELECYLFAEMLICVKEKKNAQYHADNTIQARTKCTLKGSIMIKKHLNQIDCTAEEEGILTLNLSVAELPSFHLQFPSVELLEGWKIALMSLNKPSQSQISEYDGMSATDDDTELETIREQESSVNSSYGAGRSFTTAPTEYSDPNMNIRGKRGSPVTSHIPVDVVLVIPVSSSMHGLKISVLKDTIRFLVQSLGERDRIGIVTFGSSAGAIPLVGMTPKSWPGWNNFMESIRPIGQKSPRADLVEGANVAMDLLMQRKMPNPLSSIFIISDSSSADAESIDFVVSRAEAARVSVHCFGLGLTHKPDTMIELSTRTKASYTYAKDWMMLRECAAGCLGSLQSTSHQNVKVKLRLPDGSPAKFVKISGALQTTKRSNGRDIEASLGDLRFGDKRDLLVQLAITPHRASTDQLAKDPWETIVSDLEALGGDLDEEESRANSVEEVPIIQADLVYNDIMREGVVSQLPRPSLLAITMLQAPPNARGGNQSRPITPPIPPDSRVVQRRMELLTSDMLSRALTLVTRGQYERARHLLCETRSILQGLGKGGLPPLPPSRSRSRPSTSHPNNNGNAGTAPGSPTDSPPPPEAPERRPPSPIMNGSLTPAAGIDNDTIAALDTELKDSLEWIRHPTVFGRDSRKAVLQAIGVISSQRAYTFRSPLESLWSRRIPGVRSNSEGSKLWREAGEEALMEES